MTFVVDLSSKNMPCNSSQVGHRQCINLVTHLLGPNFASMNLNLSTKILEFDKARLEVHQ